MILKILLTAKCCNLYYYSSTQAFKWKPSWQSSCLLPTLTGEHALWQAPPTLSFLKLYREITFKLWILIYSYFPKLFLWKDLLELATILDSWIEIKLSIILNQSSWSMPLLQFEGKGLKTISDKFYSILLFWKALLELHCLI